MEKEKKISMMRRWGVAAKLVGEITATIAIVVAMLLLIVYNYVSDTLLEQSEKLLEQTTDTAIQETKAWIDKTLTMLEMERDTIEFGQQDAPEMMEYIRHTVDPDSAYPAGIYVALTDGTLYHASFVPGPDFNVLEKSWYQDGIQSEDFIFIKSVGCHGDDRDIGNVRVIQRTDLPCRFITIHDRHLDIHQDQVILARFCALHLLHCNGADIRHIHNKTDFLEDLHSDLLVQFIILHQKDLLSMERNRLIRIVVCILVRKRYLQDLSEFRQKDRFRAESRNACFSCLFFNIRPIIGCQDDDRQILSDKPPDPSHHFDPIHIRHEPVYDIHGVLVILFPGKFYPEYCLLTGRRPVRPHTDVGQHLRHAGAGIKIIVHHKRPKPLQLRDRFLPYRTRTSLKLQRYRKCGPFSHLAFHRDGAAHHVHNVPGDRHAETSPLYPADRTRPLTLKRIEDMF